MNIEIFKDKVFRLSSNTQREFEEFTLELFRFQSKNNAIYQEYISLLNISVDEVIHSSQVPFMPISFFKEFEIRSVVGKPSHTFTSSGTTGSIQSKHHIKDIHIYEKSFLTTFQHFYGPIENYCILALLPSYLERQGSSLIYMAGRLIETSKHPESGFYLNEFEKLNTVLNKLEKQEQKTLLLGVSFALLDFAETFKPNLNHTVVMETGGMKGRRKEMIRAELHENLQRAFGVQHIHSEYGMTELLSQGYSKGNGVFNCPSWMRILTRDTEDALSILPKGRAGGINVVDLANINSCSFIATQDLGRVFENQSFEIIGRFDNSDIRGCNLMVL